MKSLLMFTALTVLIGGGSSFTQHQDDQKQTPAQLKVKAKGAKSFTRDKSKPVRKAIEEWYDRNIAAFNAKDVAAIMNLRTDDFHTITPDGKVNTRADMEARTRVFVGRIDHFISQSFKIGTIEVEGDLASAYITQRTVRMQRFPDGTLHKVEAGAVQRETWRKTAAGWKLYKVDDIRDDGLLVDDKPFDAK
ncbi:MAG TPA: nuclear transport factor 2 family protein [Pyrinomonadaceae bacterium]